MSFSKEFVEEQKEKLLQEKEKLETELKNISTKDPQLAGDYDASFPDYGRAEDENAQEEEEYFSRVGRENSFEQKLCSVNEALKKISEGGYGVCVKCGKEISEERLEVEPAAQCCIDHN